MSTQVVTLDVIDRPAGGVLAADRTLLAVARSEPPAGCLGVVPCMTADFSPRPWPRLTPRRAALLAAWADPDAAGRFRRAVVTPLATGAREHWHVRGELCRVGGRRDDWRRWAPDPGDAAPPADDEPLLVLISGELRLRTYPAFFRDGAIAVRHADVQPGYLGGLGLASSWTNTTSCSAWRSAADARAYAFRPGGHAEAMKRDYAQDRHVTERFLRVRPHASSGTLRGRDPFARVLGARAAAIA